MTGMTRQTNPSARHLTYVLCILHRAPRAMHPPPKTRQHHHQHEVGSKTTYAVVFARPLFMPALDSSGCSVMNSR
jgi:hypothetical protein